VGTAGGLKIPKSSIDKHLRRLQNKHHLSIDPLHPIEYNRGMENEITQQLCVACGQVLTLSEPMPEVEYCFTCTKEIESINNEMSDEDWDAWATEYELEEKAAYYGSINPHSPSF